MGRVFCQGPDFGRGPCQVPDLERGRVWRPGQLISANSKELDFTGKIVIIGSDYEENGDYHKTPFGPMAGSYILANGLNMLLTGRMIEEAMRINLALMVLTGLLASFLYARFRPFGPTLFFFGVALVSPWLSAWAFNRYGFFVDVWLPALGVGGYCVLAEQNTKWRLYFGRGGLFRNLLRRIR
jgi:CHASE2 domain-containing sensor protein